MCSFTDDVSLEMFKKKKANLTTVSRSIVKMELALEAFTEKYRAVLEIV